MHDPTHEYDDNCHGCQPVMIDARTGEVLPDDNPKMQTLLQVWKEQTTLEERRAYHRTLFQGSMNQKDHKIAQKVAARMQIALEGMSDT